MREVERGEDGEMEKWRDRELERWRAGAHLDMLDALGGQDGSRATDGAQVEAAMRFAGLGDRPTPVPLRQHHLWGERAGL